jgi:protein TonB
MSKDQEKKYRIRTLDDIVFENRNKEYGCYFLRATHKRRLLASMIWAFSGFLLTIGAFYFFEIRPWNKQFNPSDFVSMDDISYDKEMVTLLSQLTEIQPDQKTPITLSLEPGSDADSKQEVINRTEIPVIELKPILPKEDTSRKRLVENVLRKYENQAKKSSSVQKDSLSMFLEKVPEYPGGYIAVQAYFYKNQHYPENALIHGIHGSTVVGFVVNANGGVEKPSIVKGIDPELDQEAIRLVKAMPRWQPAYYKGKPIASMMIMPVDFKIK